MYNRMDLCSFMGKGKTEQSRNGMTFQSAESSRKLSISFALGVINYETASDNELPTNVLAGVPNDKQALKVAQKLLPKLGINLSEISKKQNRSEANLGVTFDEITLFPKNHKMIKIIKWLSGDLRR